MVVELQDAAQKLDKLADTAMTGEEVTLTRGGRPLVKLTPVTSPSKRQLGGLEHMGYTIPEDFDSTFDKEVEEMFYGSSDTE